MKTMILDNDVENIKVYDEAGIDRIFIDLEKIGKLERQGHLDTVISYHSIKDIQKVKPILNNSKLLVRVNPIYHNSIKEINQVIDYGADIIMLPMFRYPEEVESFIKIVNSRATTCLLLETSEALARLEDILAIDGIDEIHIGLNDLHLAMGLDFMFELMGNGLIEYIADKIKEKGIPFGIGGVARMEEGLLPGHIVIKEHVRLGSSMVILSRTFKNGIEIDKTIIKKEIVKLQKVEERAKLMKKKELLENKFRLKTLAKQIASKMKNGKQNIV